MITVQEAENILFSELRDFGTEEISYEQALGRVLAENLLADRDLPPFDRPTVDGIAIDYDAYHKGVHSFSIKATQAAGDSPNAITDQTDCIEIMTGAALDQSVNTVIRYEDLSIENGIASIQNIEVKKGQNIHLKGKDKKQGDLLVKANQLITPAIIGVAASIGKIKLSVKKVPRVIIISTGDEMVDPSTDPTPFQLRRSNGITIKAALTKFGIHAELLHLNDNYEIIRQELKHCLNDYDVLLMSGGVSMGKFDYVPKVLEELGVQKLFHKIKQRPGKPFWFGKSPEQKLIFAFPGNPVSVFMCLHRYFVPWLEQSLQTNPSPQYAMLNNDIQFPYSLQYFAQVKLRINETGQLTAESIDTNGSGDFSHLPETDAFMELPLEQEVFRKGEMYRVWKYNL